MNEMEALLRADEELRSVVDEIGDERWDQPVPEDFPTRDEQSYTLRQLLAYQAYDEAWLPEMVRGRTISDVGEDAFGQPFDNELLDGDPHQRFAELVDRTSQAVGELNEADLDQRVVHYSYGDYPLREALWHAIVFRAMRAHDFAGAIGLERDLPDDLVRAVWDIVEPHAEEWRAIGVFGPKVGVADDAPLQDRLLGLTGRQPKDN